MRTINAPQRDFPIDVQSKGRTMNILVIVVTTLVGVSSGQWNTFGRTGRVRGHHVAPFSQPGRSNFDPQTPVNQDQDPYAHEIVGPTGRIGPLGRAAKRTSLGKATYNRTPWPHIGRNGIAIPPPQRRQRNYNRIGAGRQRQDFTVWPTFDVPFLHLPPPLLWNPPGKSKTKLLKDCDDVFERQDLLFENPQPYSPLQQQPKPLDYSDAVRVKQHPAATSDLRPLTQQDLGVVADILEQENEEDLQEAPFPGDDPMAVLGEQQEALVPVQEQPLNPMTLPEEEGASMLQAEPDLTVGALGQSDGA